MPVKVDEVVQDVKVTRASMETNKGALAAKGYGPNRVAKFDTLQADLSAKTSAQNRAQDTLAQRTKDQNNMMAAAAEIITRLQDAASSAYGKGSPTLKEFRVGVNKPRSVGKMETTLEYLTGVAAEHASDLIANGFSQEDIDEISTIYGKLVAADTVQENAKKIRNTATEARDEALAAMKAEMFKLRKFVNGAFSKDKAMIEQFKAVKRGRGKAAAKPTPPSPEAPKQ